MLEVVGIGCGIVLGFVGSGLAVPLYWRLLISGALPANRLIRQVLRAQRALLARTGRHAYLVSCLEALESAPDAAALRAARGRLAWWCALRRRSGP
jgi:hypothetical protein